MFDEEGIGDNKVKVLIVEEGVPLADSETCIDKASNLINKEDILISEAIFLIAKVRVLIVKEGIL